MNDSSIDLEALLNTGYRYALSLSRDKAIAEDLLQDAWVAVLQANGPQTKAYLYSAIRSRFLNHNKREQLVSIVPLETSEDGDSAYSQDNWPESLDSRIIFDAMKTLRSLEREALFLNVVEGYTAQEIANLTQQPRGSILSLIYRAKNKLKKFITLEYPEVLP